MKILKRGCYLMEMPLKYCLFASWQDDNTFC
jgi:hypothetical protein